MKKIFHLLLTAALIVSLSACGNKETPKNSTTVTDDLSKPQISNNIDVDLTKLSSTMVYSEVYNMMVSPESYIGKTVKMKGQFVIYQDIDENGQIIPDKIYFACIIANATACCTQGLEFVLAGDYKYPENYPELYSEITVEGTFEIYEENGYKYCRLADAKFSD